MSVYYFSQNPHEPSKEELFYPSLNLPTWRSIKLESPAISPDQFDFISHIKLNGHVRLLQAKQLQKIFYQIFFFLNN